MGLLVTPNPDDPLVASIAETYQNNRYVALNPCFHYLWGGGVGLMVENCLTRRRRSMLRNMLCNWSSVFGY